MPRATRSSGVALARVEVRPLTLPKAPLIRIQYASKGLTPSNHNTTAPIAKARSTATIGSKIS